MKQDDIDLNKWLIVLNEIMNISVLAQASLTEHPAYLNSRNLFSHRFGADQVQDQGAGWFVPSEDSSWFENGQLFTVSSPGFSLVSVHRASSYKDTNSIRLRLHP